MSLIYMFIWLVGFTYLLLFSNEDLKKKEVNNVGVFCFFILGMVVVSLIEKSWIVMALMCVTAIMGLVMWNKKIIGGADVKILPSMIPFIMLGSTNYFYSYLSFLLIFAMVGSSYALIYKNFFGKKRTKYIPFVPALVITYVLSALLIR